MEVSDIRVLCHYYRLYQHFSILIPACSCDAVCSQIVFSSNNHNVSFVSATCFIIYFSFHAQWIRSHSYKRVAFIKHMTYRCLNHCWFSLFAFYLWYLYPSKCTITSLLVVSLTRVRCSNPLPYEMDLLYICTASILEQLDLLISGEAAKNLKSWHTPNIW